jgi:glutathione S-transferase
MIDMYRLHYAPDNASLIIRLALEEIGVPYETVLVDRAVKAHKSAGYLQLNPAGLIPVLETPHGPMFETGAILLWLADTHTALAPAPNALDRGAFLKWLFFVSNTLHADLRLTFYPEFYAGPDATTQAALTQTVQMRLRQHLTLLDDLTTQAPGWFTADRPSTLTLYVACLMRWMKLYPSNGNRNWFDLGNTPSLRLILAELEQRPSVQSSCHAEGLGPSPFTAPIYATPPEGSPT